MKAMKGLHLFLVLTVLVSAAGIFASAADAQTIHYLQIIDNGNPQTAVRAMIDMIKMEAFMGSEVQTMIGEKIPSAKIKKSELLFNDQQATRDNIFGWIRDVNLGSDDVVCVYFSGHGGADKTETKDMFITTPSETKTSLSKRDSLKPWKRLGCRLKIFITDACSAGPRG